jgi:hypothetical protein
VSEATRVLRRTLEEALDTRRASSILFEALNAAGKRVPRTHDEVLAVLRGPLRGVLARQLGDEEAGALVGRIESALMPACDPVDTQEVPLDELAAQTRLEDATAVFPTEDRAVPILIAAAGRGFEQRVAIALGERRAAPTTVSSHEGLQRALDRPPPAVYLIDATDFPAIDPGRLLNAARALPSTTVCVVWGVDLPFGRNLARAVAAHDRTWVLLELREGIAPLLDLVRSRRKSRVA